MGFLLYQTFTGEKVRAEGEWNKSAIQDIKGNDFFVTNHDKSLCYSFTIKTHLNESGLSHLAKSVALKKSENVILSEGKYYELLNEFKFEMTKRKIDKAIFSRIDQATTELDFVGVFNELCQKYKNKAFVYALVDPVFGIWIGATPEILIEGDENRLKTVALAGTKKEQNDKWTLKEREEQSMVTDFIYSKLSQSAVQNLVKGDCETIDSGAVFHLATRFEFQVPFSNVDDLINDLHPTPAVCGLPRDKAMQLIHDFEPHERKFYTGILGWVKDNEVQTYVNLRCMEYFKGSCDLYVGGGITSNSVIENEWLETKNKANTLRSVL